MEWDLPQDYRRIKQPQRREVRLQYIVEQDGKCAHCQSDLSDNPRADIAAKPIRWGLFPGGEGFLRHPVHLHHDHKTGMTIGAVHAYCNAVLWQYHKE